MFIKIASLNVLNNLDKSLVQAKKIEYKDQKFGQLTLLIESSETGSGARKVVAKIEDLLLNNYYKNDKMLLSEQINSLKIEAFFEASLVKTNRDLIDYINIEKIEINLKNINLTVCLVYEGEIFLSNLGGNKSFLLRKVRGELEMSDINPEDEPEEDDNQGSKIFSSIINGEIPSNSYIIITTLSLAQYLLNKKMVEILERLNLESAKEHIRSTLKKINNHSNFAGVIIKNSSNKERDDNLLNIRNISQSKKETQKILEKTGNIDKKRIRKNILSFLNKINIFEHLNRNIEKRRKESIKPKPSPVIEMVTNSSKNTSKTKKVAIIIVALCVILAIKLMVQKNNESKEVEIERIIVTEQELKSKQGQIDTLLLYNNKDEAITKIQELREEIQSLSQKERDAMNELPEIEKELKRQENSISKMIEIENPKELTHLNLLKENVDSSSLSILNGFLYISDKNGSIYSIDIKEGINTILENSDKIKSSKIISKEKGDIIYLLTSSHLITINKNKEVKYKEANIDIDSALDFDLYMDRLYVANSDQVYRYNRGDKYENPEGWLKNTISEGIVSINTSSDIEIIFNNGVVSQYRTGESLNNDISLGYTDPKLEKINTVKVVSNYLYILDKSNKRIIKFDKLTGDLLSQYYLPNLNDIKDFTIDEENNTLYILNENKIYKEEMLMS